MSFRWSDNYIICINLGDAYFIKIQWYVNHVVYLIGLIKTVSPFDDMQILLLLLFFVLMNLFLQN